MDVVGYNYKEQYYEEDHKRFPEKPFFGSENGHSMEAWGRPSATVRTFSDSACGPV